MSLEINAKKITQVMIGDQWHHVEPGTFYVDAYEIHDGDGDDPDYYTYAGHDPLIPKNGYSFKTTDVVATITGPLTAIQAIRTE